MPNTSRLNQVDLGFVVDTTGSMGSFIHSAKRRMSNMVVELSSDRELDVRCVLIDYRDHPPEDPSYPAKLHTGKSPVSVDQFQSALMNLGLGHGGDAPESVLDGIHMLADVEWRPHSRRIAFLVGDAPAHGYCTSYPDHWPQGCPCGRTSEGVTADIEDLGIVMYGIVVSSVHETLTCFQEFCGYTGGSVLQGEGLGTIQKFLQEEFSTLAFDQDVLDRVGDNEDWSVEDIARAMSSSPMDVDAAVRRLLGRDLIPLPATS